MSKPQNLFYVSHLAAQGLVDKVRDAVTGDSEELPSTASFSKSLKVYAFLGA